MSDKKGLRARLYLVLRKKKKGLDRTFPHFERTEKVFSCVKESLKIKQDNNFSTSSDFLYKPRRTTNSQESNLN